MAFRIAIPDTSDLRILPMYLSSQKGGCASSITRDMEDVLNDEQPHPDHYDQHGGRHQRVVTAVSGLSPMQGALPRPTPTATPRASANPLLANFGSIAQR